MRGVSRVVRSVAVLSLMVVLASPMQAASSDEATWIGKNRQRIVKFLNKLGLRSLGDLLVDPIP
jgi:hypothetical protein